MRIDADVWTYEFLDNCMCTANTKDKHMEHMENIHGNSPPTPFIGPEDIKQDQRASKGRSGIEDFLHHCGKLLGIATIVGSSLASPIRSRTASGIDAWPTSNNASSIQQKAQFLAPWDENVQGPTTVSTAWLDTSTKVATGLAHAMEFGCFALPKSSFSHGCFVHFKLHAKACHHFVKPLGFKFFLPNKVAGILQLHMHGVVLLTDLIPHDFMKQESHCPCDVWTDWIKTCSFATLVRFVNQHLVCCFHWGSGWTCDTEFGNP